MIHAIDIVGNNMPYKTDKMKLVRTEYEDKAWQNLMEKHFEQWYNQTFKSE